MQLTYIHIRLHPGLLLLSVCESVCVCVCVCVCWCLLPALPVEDVLWATGGCGRGCVFAGGRHTPLAVRGCSYGENWQLVMLNEKQHMQHEMQRHEKQIRIYAHMNTQHKHTWQRLLWGEGQRNFNNALHTWFRGMRPLVSQRPFASGGHVT